MVVIEGLLSFCREQSMLDLMAAGARDVMRRESAAEMKKEVLDDSLLDDDE